jgi:hypothetical protein
MHESNLPGCVRAACVARNCGLSEPVKPPTTTCRDCGGEVRVIGSWDASGSYHRDEDAAAEVDRLRRARPWAALAEAKGTTK